MRVLVTGGAGYIGSHTVRALINAGHNPIVIDNLIYGHANVITKIFKIPLIVSNIGNKKVLKEVIYGNHASLKKTVHENNTIEAVLHFAAFAYVGESIKNPMKYYLNNVQESISLLEVISDKKIRSQRKDKSSIPILFSSSCATYGIPNQNPISEETPQKPISPYGRSKLMIEEIIKDLAKSANLKSVILRYFNAAGASEDTLIGENHVPETHLIPLVINAAIGINKEIKIFGNDFKTHDGTCIRDYIHVEDLANAHVLALDIFVENSKIHNKLNIYKKNGNCNIYNLGNGKGVSVLEIIKKVEAVTKKKVRYKITPRRPGDPPFLIASASKFKRDFEWNPKYNNIEEIILHAYKWAKKLNLRKNI